MLSDRPYMQDNRPEERTSVLGWLIAAIISGFVLQTVMTRLFQAGPAMESLFAVTPAALRSGRVWTLFTYAFLHDQDNLLHVLTNVLAVYFLGRPLLPLLGPKRFVGLFASAVALGGVCWAAANWQAPAMLLGASAGASALLIVFACFYPDREMTFLLFFIIPVSLKPKYMALACVAIDLFGCVFYELLGTPSPFGLAHSAHLGGMAAGWLYFQFAHNARWRLPLRRASSEAPRWSKRAAQQGSPAPAYRVNLTNRESLKAEVDRILDKINSKGFGALTPEEKRLLDDAHDLLSRR